MQLRWVFYINGLIILSRVFFKVHSNLTELSFQGLLALKHFYIKSEQIVLSSVWLYIVKHHMLYVGWCWQDGVLEYIFHSLEETIMKTASFTHLFKQF